MVPTKCHSNKETPFTEITDDPNSTFIYHIVNDFFSNGCYNREILRLKSPHISWFQAFKCKIQKTKALNRLL